MAVPRSTRQPGWATRGRVPGRVRTQAATTSSPILSGESAPRSSSGHEPDATSGRCVTPTLGRSSSAPSCSASPARRGWSRPVPSTSRTSGLRVRAPVTPASSGPRRNASSPGVYGARRRRFAPPGRRGGRRTPPRPRHGQHHRRRPGRSTRAGSRPSRPPHRARRRAAPTPPASARPARAAARRARQHSRATCTHCAPTKRREDPARAMSSPSSNGLYLQRTKPLSKVKNQPTRR
jgi:hypothetical protein